MVNKFNLLRPEIFFCLYSFNHISYHIYIIIIILHNNSSNRSTAIKEGGRKLIHSQEEEKKMRQGLFQLATEGTTVSQSNP